MPEATGAASDAARSTGRPPRDNLVRAMRGGVGVRNSVRAEKVGVFSRPPSARSRRTSWSETRAAAVPTSRAW